jgi:hypothetical protein
VNWQTHWSVTIQVVWYFTRVARLLNSDVSKQRTAFFFEVQGVQEDEGGMFL